MTSQRVSAGLLLHRRTAEGVREVLLAHFGGPFFANKDHGAWAIPKGEVEAGEDLLATAIREFGEELGVPPPPGPLSFARRSETEGRQNRARVGRGW